MSHMMFQGNRRHHVNFGVLEMVSFHTKRLFKNQKAPLKEISV